MSDDVVTTDTNTVPKLDWDRLTPEGLRHVALMLDLMDEALRLLIPFHPTASEESKAEAGAVFQSDEMQQALRRWADALEPKAPHPAQPLGLARLHAKRRKYKTQPAKPWHIIHLVGLHYKAACGSPAYGGSWLNEYHVTCSELPEGHIVCSKCETAVQP